MKLITGGSAIWKYQWQDEPVASAGIKLPPTRRMSPQLVEIQ